MQTDDRVTIDRLMSEPPSGRLALLRASGDAAEALQRLSDEADRVAADDVVRGLEVREALVAIADELGEARGRAETRRGLVESLANVGRLEESRSLGESTVAITDQFELDDVIRGRSRLALVLPLRLLGLFDAAISTANDALMLFNGIGDKALAARAFNNLGTVAESQGNLSLAIEYFDRALANIGDAPDMRASVQSNRGLALLTSGRLAEAERAFIDASTEARAAELSWMEGIAIQNLAFLSVSQGKYARAMRYYEQALRAFETDGAETDIALLRLDQAKALLSLGVYESAVAEFERAAVGLDDIGFANEAAEAREGIGEARLRMGDVESARSALTEALLRYRTLGVGKRAQWAQLHLAQCESLAGHLDDAASLISEILDSTDVDALQMIQGNQMLAEIALARGNLNDAQARVDDALRLAQELDLAPPLADLYSIAADVQRSAGDPVRERDLLQKAIGQVERVRGALQAERFRSAWLGNRLSIYDKAVRNALDTNTTHSLAESFSLAERVKGRVLLDQLDGALDLAVTVDVEDPGVQRVADRLSQVQAELNWQYSQLSSEEGVSAPDQDWQARTRSLESEADDLRDRLATASGQAALYAPTATISQVQAALHPHEALVEYAVDGERLVAYVLKHETFHVQRGLPSIDEVAGQSERVMFQIGRGLVGGVESLDTPRGNRLLTAINSELKSAYDALITPLEHLLEGVNTLHLVPQGPMHQLPFAALYSGHEYLCERFTLTAASSSSLFLWQRSRTDLAPASKAVIVGVPDPMAPRIAEEVATIRALLPDPEVLMGPSASVESVSLAARDASLIHFACHGRFDAANPRGSGLKLADRWLTVRELPTLRTNAELVVLSGCETGRAGVSGADELVGLVQSLLAGGIRTVVYSLWIVNDGTTMELMDAFYRSMVEGQNPAAALRTAQCAILKVRKHPAFWAPFVAGGQA